jgi:chromosome partitioning protein
MTVIYRHTKIFGVINNKGGIGKTTTTEELGHALAAMGLKVLLVDTDSQMSLTKNLGVEPSVAQASILALLKEPDQGIARAIVHYQGTAQYPISYPDGGCLDLIPGAKTIAEAPGYFDKTITRQPVTDFNLVIPYLFSTADAADYDIVLIDSGPSTDRISTAVIVGSHYVIAPVSTEPMAVDGSAELLKTIRESNATRAALSKAGTILPETQLVGLLISKVYPDQQQAASKFQAYLDKYGIKHFNGVTIPYTTPGWEAASANVPIGVFAPGDAAAVAYVQVAQQIATL